MTRRILSKSGRTTKPVRPEKPDPDFPLTAHAALNEWLEVKDDTRLPDQETIREREKRFRNALASTTPANLLPADSRFRSEPNPYGIVSKRPFRPLIS